MEKVILHPAYFPNIIQFSHLVYADEVLLEINDFYEKQTYRSRMKIQSPNGNQLLSVPIKHTKSDGKQYYKEVKISYDFDWQKLHWRSLETAYRTSPYFEFYEDDLLPLFRQKTEKLVDLNLRIIQRLFEILEVERTFILSTEYINHYVDYKDLRFLKNAKTPLEIEGKLPHYTQIFSDRFDFMPNLSIADLLFMEGPNALAYLEEVYKITKDKL